MPVAGCAGLKMTVSVAFTDHSEETDPMPASPHDLFAFLDRLGVRHATVTHPPLFTVADSQSLRGQIAGGHTKNLFLKDKAGALVLVVADEVARIDLKSIHHRIAAKRVSFGSSELLMQHLGVLPGSVTPFARSTTREGRFRSSSMPR